MTYASEKYKARSGTQDEGKDYELEMTTYLALRSIGLAKDVSIAFNADGVGDFDDVVLMLTTENDERFDFLLQLKHKADPNDLTHSELLEGHGKLPFTKYLENIITIKNDVKIKKKKGTITNDLGLFNNIYFVLYTNRGMNLKNFNENKWEFYEIDKDDENTTFLKKLLNTYEDDHCVFKFILSDIPEDITKEDTENFTNFRFLTNQISFKELHQEIAAEIRKIAPFNLLKIDENDIADEFIKFIKNWAKGLLANHHYLKKDAIMFKLTELYLSQYEVNLRPELFQDYGLVRQSIWNELVLDQTVTIVDSNETNSNFMIRFISNEVGKYCDGTGRNWNDKLTKKEQQVFYKDSGEMQQTMMKSITNHGKIALIDIYKCLWKVKKLPLLLRVDNSEEYENIIKILELSHFSHSVIILNGTSKPLPKVGDVQTFLSLQDLTKEKREMILQQPSRLQGRILSHLGNLLDDTMFEDIKSSDVIKILSGQYSIGEKIKVLPRYFIHRNTSKIFIKSQVFDYNNGDKFYFKEKDKLPNYPDMIITDLEQISRCLGNVHYCSVYDENYLEWKGTFRSTQGLKYWKEGSKLVYEAKISSSHHTNIVSEVPGMGKSIFMDFIARKTPSTKWVLRIDLNKHLKYYRKNECKNRNTKAEMHLKYFFNEQDKDVLTKKVFEKLLNDKKIIVLLDGFDEISITNKSEVTNIAMSLQKDGYHMWLTTRPHMLEHLEENLNAFAISLQPFTKDNQKEFLFKFFMDKTDGAEQKRIKEFVESLLVATKENLYDYEAKFTGIPLQTELLADYFLAKCQECLGNSSEIAFKEKFDLLDLYRSFIKKKIEELDKRFDQSALMHTDECRSDQPLLSLQLVFPLEDFEEIPEIKKKNEYYKRKLDKKQHLQREGVITLDEQFNLNYNHRSFAEFQAAQWLSENLHTNQKHLQEFIQDLTKQRFSKNYQFLFNIFDRVLAQDCELLMSVICGQFDKAKTMINLETLKERDQGGRTILHILALYDEEEQLSENKKSKAMEIIENIPNLGKLSSIRDILGFTALDYALANKSSLILANALCSPKHAPIKAQIDQDSIWLNLSKCDELSLKPLFDLLLPYFVSRDFIQAKTPNTNVKAYLRSKSFDHKSKYVTNLVGSTVLKFLQSYKGFPYARYDNNYYSDVRYAIRFGDKKNIEDVLSKTEDINCKDVDNNTPIFYAIINEDLDTIRILLEKGADVNKKNSENRTSLHMGFLTKNLDIIKLILSKNPNYNACDNKAQNILHYAVAYGNYDIIVKIIPNVDVNKQDNKGNIPLHLAFKENKLDIAKLLIDSNSDVKILNYDNHNALHYSIRYDTENLIHKTCFKNVDPNIPDTEGNTPLHLELQNASNINTVRFLISNNAKVSVQNLQKETPLHLILNKPNSSNSVVKLLLDHGADVNATNGLEETAVHCAIKNRNMNIVRDLIPKFNDRNQRDCHGDTCLHLAAKNGDSEVINLLISSKVNFNGLNNEKQTPLHLATQARSLDSMSVLLDKGAWVNKFDNYGNSPLHLAVSDENLPAVEILLKNGANVNIKNNRGQSALGFADKTGNMKIQALLYRYVNKNGTETSFRTNQSQNNRKRTR